MCKKLWINSPFWVCKSVWRQGWTHVCSFNWLSVLLFSCSGHKCSSETSTRGRGFASPDRRQRRRGSKRCPTHQHPSGAVTGGNPARRSPPVLRSWFLRLRKTGDRWWEAEATPQDPDPTTGNTQMSSDESSSGVRIRPSSYRVFFCRKCCLMGFMRTTHTHTQNKWIRSSLGCPTACLYTLWTFF